MPLILFLETRGHACRVLPVMPLAYLEHFFLPVAIFQTICEPRDEFEFMVGVVVALAVSLVTST